MTTKMNAADLIQMTEARVGVIIAYPGDERPFYVERASKNTDGTVVVHDYAGDSRTLTGEVDVHGTYNL